MCGRVPRQDQTPVFDSSLIRVSSELNSVVVS